MRWQPFRSMSCRAAWGAAAVLAAVAAARAEEWPKMPPVPKELVKGEPPPLRYGRPVWYFSPQQRQALWDARVRKDHPRIYITAETLPALRKRMADHPAYPELVRKAEAGDPLAAAFVFQITGNKAHARTALRVFDNLETKKTALKRSGTGEVYRNALIFDWCFPAIEDERMETIVKGLASTGLADSKTDPGHDAPKQFQRLRWGFPGGGGGNIEMIHTYFALAHHWPDAQVEAMNFLHPDGSGLGDVLANHAYSVDGSEWLGEHKAFVHGGQHILCAFLLASATGLNVFDEEKWAGLHFNNHLYWWMYLSEHAGGHEMEYHYAPGSRGPSALRRENFGLHAANFHARNPHYQWFINHVLCPGGPVKFFKDRPAATERLIELAIWYDPTIPERKPDDIPRSRFVAPGKMQSGVFRSGFRGRGDAIVWNMLSDSWDGDSIGGAIFSSFKIFKDELLVGPTMNGPFWRVPYGHSTMTFWDTSTRAEKGFDRPVHPDYVCAFRRLDFLTTYPNKIEGTVTGFQTRDQYDYLAFRGEPTFYPRDVVKEWTGQVVFLRPGVMVRFERTEVADRKYQPRFFLWIKGERPTVSGKVVNSVVYDHVEDYDGDEAGFLGQLRLSRLHVKSLLPKDRLLRLAHGTLADAPTTSLVATKYRTLAGPSPTGGFDGGHGKGGRLVLNMTHATARGTQEVPAFRVDTAPQTTAGNFTVTVEKDNLRVVQTSGNKNKKLLFAWYPTLTDMLTALRAEQFHGDILANYENWVEGNIWRRSLLEEEQQPPAFDSQGRLSDARRKEILSGDPGSRPDILNPRASGHIEVRLPQAQAEPRQYFLTVITATNEARTDPPVPTSTLEEDAATATAVVKSPDGEARITFAKTGPAAGRIKIVKAEKTVVDEEFLDKIDLSNQPMGSDFLKGRRK